ncbi:MAG: OmpA family protein [Candidatus Dependentiae bacterium]|nr:OmpA family protein [Candidatus Dependentiae bacterium]
MQISSKKFILFSLLLATFLGGCKKNKKQSDQDNGSFFSKSSKKATPASSAEPFELDNDSMKTFALDDKISKHRPATKSSQKSSDNPLFSWENVGAEESKHQFKTLYFDFNVDTLKPSQNAALSQDIAQAKKMIKQGKTLVIEGHACHSEGSAIYNLALSERRARFVAQKFAEEGIDSSHIKIAPRGQEMPVRKGGNRKQQAVNRRVEIFALDAQHKN